MRLDRFLSNSKIGSRREVRALIKSKRVRVNDMIIVDPSFKISSNDIVQVNGMEIHGHREVYIKLYKPKDFLSATFDEKHKTVFELIDHNYKDELAIAGRLDKNSEGLLILTNDGELLHRIISPRFSLEKVYEVIIGGLMDDYKSEKLRKGFELDDGYFTKPMKFYECNKLFDRVYKVKIGLFEGKFHIIKRIFKSLNCEVKNIKRLSIGPVGLDEDMKPGGWKEIPKDEIEELFRRLGLNLSNRRIDLD